MEKRDFLKMCAVGAVVAPVALAGCNPPAGTAGKTAAETSFDRMLRTRTIRASYATYAPGVMVDPNTQKKSGIFFDLMNMVGEKLDMDVVWGEEVGWGDIGAGLQARRYDVCAANIWPNAARARVGNFTMPTYYSATYAYVRKGEKRIRTYADINQPSVRIAVMDNDGYSTMLQTRFSKARHVSIPEGVDTKQRLMDVIAGKADVTFDDAYFAHLFMKENPGKLERLAVRDPIQVFANTMMFGNDDWRVKLLLDTAMGELHNSGVVADLVEKYTGRADTFLPVAKPYGDVRISG